MGNPNHLKTLQACYVWLPNTLRSLILNLGSKPPFLIPRALPSRATAQFSSLFSMFKLFPFYCCNFLHDSYYISMPQCAINYDHSLKIPAPLTIPSRPKGFWGPPSKISLPFSYLPPGSTKFRHVLCLIKELLLPHYRCCFD